MLLLLAAVAAAQLLRRGQQMLLQGVGLAAGVLELLWAKVWAACFRGGNTWRGGEGALLPYTHR